MASAITSVASASQQDKRTSMLAGGRVAQKRTCWQDHTRGTAGPCGVPAQESASVPTRTKLLQVLPLLPYPEMGVCAVTYAHVMLTQPVVPSAGVGG